MRRSAESAPSDPAAVEEVEEATEGNGRDTPVEPAPLAGRRWRHPWSHRRVDTAELPNG